MLHQNDSICARALARPECMPNDGTGGVIYSSLLLVLHIIAHFSTCATAEYTNSSHYLLVCQSIYMHHSIVVKCGWLPIAHITHTHTATYAHVYTACAAHDAYYMLDECNAAYHARSLLLPRLSPLLRRWIASIPSVPPCIRLPHEDPIRKSKSYGTLLQIHGPSRILVYLG